MTVKEETEARAVQTEALRALLAERRGGAFIGEAERATEPTP